MSFNRRRWSNEFLDSLIDFQTRDSDSVHSTILFDSLENKRTEISVDSLDNKCMDINSMLALKNNSTNFVNSQESLKKDSITNLISDSDNNPKTGKPNNATSLSMIKDRNISKEDLNSTLSVDDINININMSIKENDIPDTREHLNVIPSPDDQLFNLNERLRENIDSSSNSKTIDQSFYEHSTQTKAETQSKRSQCTNNSTLIFKDLIQLDDMLNVNEKTMKNISISSASETIKLSSCNSSIQTNVQTEPLELENNQCSIQNSRQDQVNQRLFSTPIEFSPSKKEIIAEMNKPDIWDTLLALEQVLSPVEEKAPSFEECSQEYPQILNRLSQKFRKTPTRFTEKLVSIIEDSVISSESPTKQCLGDNSGISLHRMTGEFRKLCKFIEDESMPEWAPSLMNVTGSCFGNTETSEYEIKRKNLNASPKNKLSLINDTPTRRISPKAFKCLETPKNKIISNINSPINRFTPTADKSFEYWETVCNIMCDSKASAKKNARNSLHMPESSKVSMDEMLTICERQMASLDDSTIDIRSSEPCKRTDSDLKLKVVQPPRSKSESKIILNTNEKRQRSPKKRVDEQLLYELSNEHKDLKINNKLIFDNESKSLGNQHLEENIKEVHEDFEALCNTNIRENDQELFEDDFKLLLCSPEKREEKEEEVIKDLYSDNEQDCSLLVELAMRRQRCLDTAKLMLEIDREDPITNEDSKCLETLYKLGIQDKTLVEVEDDTKFLNTLSQCIDYKNYISTKSKPLLNMFNECNSPDDLKNKATSAIRYKKLSSHSKVTDCKAKNHKSALSKLPLEPKRNLQSTHDKIITSRLIEKPISKTVPKVEKKTSYFSDLQQRKGTPKVDKTAPHLSGAQKFRVIPRQISRTPIKTIPLVDKNSLQIETSVKKVPQKAMIKPSIKVSQSKVHDQKSHAQPKKFTPKVVSTASLKTTPQTDLQKVTLKVTPKLSASKTSFNVAVDDRTNESPVLRENHQNVTKAKLFVTPGKSPRDVILGRKKPPSYFLDAITKNVTPLKTDFNSIKSPISLYIHGTDTDLIQNVHGRINDRLLTPVSSGNAGKSPKLKFTLSSKENKSPTNNCNENIILPTVRYQSARKVCLIDDKSSYSPSSLTPNSKTKKLLGPIENTVVIRHEGRVVDYSPKSDYMNSETSIRVQKMAEKTMSMRKKYI